MATSRFAVILAIVAVAGAFVASSFYAAPDDPTSGAAIPDAQGEEKLIPGDSAAHAGNTDSPPEANLKTSQTSTGESHSQEVSSQAIEVPGAEVSFDDYMLLPGADAESYALVNGAMDANRLEELATPEEFDKFAGALERQAKVESRETAEEYRGNATRSQRHIRRSATRVYDRSVGERFRIHTRLTSGWTLEWQDICRRRIPVSETRRPAVGPTKFW